MPSQYVHQYERWSIRTCAIWFIFRSNRIINLSGYGWGTIGDFINEKQYDRDGRQQIVLSGDIRTRIDNGVRENLLLALKGGELVATYLELGKSARLVVPKESWSKQLIARHLFYPQQNSPIGSQHYFDLAVERESVQALWPSTKNLPRKRTGPTPKYDWPACFKHLDQLFEERGELSDEKHQWSRQAHVIIAALDFLATQGPEPGRSTVSDRVSKYLKKRNKNTS